MRTPSSPFLAVVAAAAAVSSLPAQWVTFQDQTSTRLVAASSLGASDAQEKDYAWADFDQDGDTDLFVARKQPFTTAGKFPNVLLMNEGGVLTDRTALYGSAVSPALATLGSQGMLDQTNDRDVVAVDVNGDGWLDLVTCTTLSDTVAPYLRVPRVYLNLGDDLVGSWLGFAYDDHLRIDDTTWGGFQRFCSVAAGDVDHDGDMDLYFGDYQQPTGTRPVDLNDQLLINNGLGYFTIESSTRMTTQMLESSFGMKVAMVDMNNDGWVDILKDDALNAPQAVSVSYNAGAGNPGVFTTYQEAYNNQPYHFAVGDLNNDTLPDLIFSDDGQDRYKLMTGVSGGQAVFAPEVAFSYTSGGDDGFGGNNLIVDLNNDGFNDAIVCDVDVDISGCGRRAHIFRNLGNTPNVTLQEEVIGGTVCGIPTGMLVGSFDAAVFDINGDGWKDMVLGRCGGTTVWINQPPIGVAFSYPDGLPSLLSPGAIRSFSVQATGIGGVVPQPGTGVLHYSIAGGPFQTSPLVDLGPGHYLVTLPQMQGCTSEVDFYVTVQDAGAATYADPATAPAATNRVISAVGTEVLYENDMEGAVTGWSVVNTALTGGAWEVATPNGTNVGVEFAAPPEDGEASTGATKCWVTQNGLPGGSSTAADVDGGPTDLISPPIDMAGTDGSISYRRWFYSGSTDVMQVSVSADGANWVPVETVTAPSNNVWTTHSFRVSDFIVPSATVRVRWRIQDVAPAGTVEGGVDLFRAEAFACTLCQEDIGPLGPGTAQFSICGGDLSFGTTATFAVVGAPPSAPAVLLSSLLNVGSPFGGGLLIDPAPPIGIGFAMDPAGNFVIPGFPGGLGDFQVYAQVVYADAGQAQGWGFTNGLLVRQKP